MYPSRHRRSLKVRQNCLKRVENERRKLLRKIRGPGDKCLPSHQEDSPMTVEVDNGSSSGNSESLETSKRSANQAFRMTEKCIESSLLDVVQLHLRDEKTASPAQIDMEKALKGFRVLRDPMIDIFPSISSGRTDDVDICPSMISIPGKKAPLDLTLKTSFRLVSSSSVEWCHSISLKALSSWIYPQSTLPTNIISAMASSKAKSDVEFFEKRRQDWKSSFSDLYSMLRKNLCSIFYVYTSEFVVLFVGGNFSREKWTCNAYLSKSTNSLRSALTKCDVCFTMPLYHNEVVQNSLDDLAELLEIEKRNIGQAVYTDHFADVDGTSKSLLSFTGNLSVQGLYDFLLNHRFFFTGGDVPMIYSPVPFPNSSHHFAKVVYKEMRKADMGVLSGSNEVLSNSNMCYSIEISNLIIPPWVISGICAAMSADGTSFDSTFTIDHSSMGLNAALNSISHKLESDATASASSGTNVNTFGIPNTVLVPSLHTAAVQRINFTNNAYMAYTTS